MSPAIRATEEKYGIKSDVLPPRLQKQLNDLLVPDEEIIWQGQPDPPKSDSFGCLMLMFPFGMIPLLLCVQAIVIEGNNVGKQILHVVCWVVVIGIVIAIINNCGNRFLSNSFIYAITSQRVVVVEAGKRHPEWVGIFTSDQLEGRTFSWAPYEYQNMNLPNARFHHYNANGTLGAYYRGFSFIRRKDIHKIDRLITDTFEKQQPQVSIAPISSFTSSI